MSRAPEDLQEELEHQRTMVAFFRKRLHALELQMAQQGMSTPPQIITEIDSITEQISRRDSQIARLEMLLVDRQTNLDADKQNNGQANERVLVAQKISYGIRIVTPVSEKIFKSRRRELFIEVAGTYEIKPLGTSLRLFVKTEEPLAFWRHPAVIDFNEARRKWFGKVDLWKEIGTQPYSAWIIAIVLDKAGEDIIQYASKVQREIGKNIPFDNLPSYIEKCEDEILVFRA